MFSTNNKDKYLEHGNLYSRSDSEQALEKIKIVTIEYCRGGLCLLHSLISKQPADDSPSFKFLFRSVLKEFISYSPLLLFFISFRLLFSLNFLAFIHLWYWRIWWFDLLMHFLGGFLVALVILYFLYGSGRYFYSRKIIIVWAVFISLTIGSIWEIFEISFDQFLAAQLGFRNPDILSLGWRDTLSDLLFDVFGGILAAIYFINRKKTCFLASKVLNYLRDE